jgi:psiF repeat
MKKSTWLMIPGFAAASLLLILHQPKPAAATKPSGLSAECSKQADAKGLHGKARRHFRAECKRGYKSKAS